MKNFILGLITETLAELILAFMFLIVLPGSSTLLTIHKRRTTRQSISWGPVIIAALAYVLIGFAIFWALSTELIGEEPTNGFYLSQQTNDSISEDPSLVPLSVEKMLDTMIPLWPTATPTLTSTPMVVTEDASLSTATVTPTSTSPTPIFTSEPTLSEVPNVDPTCFQGSLRITRIQPNAQTISAKKPQNIVIWGGAHDTQQFDFDGFFVEAQKQDERPSLDHIKRWNEVITEFQIEHGLGGEDQVLATWQYENWQLLFGEGEREITVWLRVAGINNQGNGLSMESQCFVPLKLVR